MFPSQYFEVCLYALNLILVKPLSVSKILLKSHYNREFFVQELCNRHSIAHRQIVVWGVNCGFNVGLSDAIWQHRTRPTLAQVMACCLTAPSHYLNQCWFLMIAGKWHSSVSNFTTNDMATILQNEFQNYNFCHISQGTMS